MHQIEIKIREAALRYILKTDINPEVRHEAEQMFANEIDLFVAGAKCAFKMIVEHKLIDKEDKK